jgi:N-acetylmuramoyl-L-alanine amidase
VSQARKLEAGKASLEKLRGDARRRRYRDGWEAVIRELEGAVKAAPAGPRAAEAALAAARARAELWEVSRSAPDARSAIASLRKVDEDHPGPLGAQALASAIALATRAGEPRDGAAAASRLAERYPQDAKAVSAAPPRAEPQKPAAVAKGAQKPVEVGDEDEDAPAAPEKAVAPPAREPELEVGREAAKVIEEMVHEAKARAAARIEGAAKAPPAQKEARALATEKDGHPSAAQDEDELPEPEAPESPPSRSTPLVRAVKDAVAALTEPEEEPAATAKAREMRTAALASGSSIAAQLGLKVRRVVVDPGHGGKDTGAIGPHGLREKDMALAIARRVAGRLKALGFTVVMTRARDRFVSLDERTRIANEAKADLFVSIHCNAARRRNLSGVETWTLNVASDRYAARLAAFENAEAERTVGDLRLILADLATKANATDARDLAQSVQSSLLRTLRGRVGRVRGHGVKQALFYVLLGTHMPSILVETGFISNPAEEARLKSTRFQEGAAEAIARGVKDFVDARRRLARVP